MRGENLVYRVALWAGWGTSPRARGKQFTPPHVVGHPRNIPACAGKTDEAYPKSGDSEEHPRVRGENQM